MLYIVHVRLKVSFYRDAVTTFYSSAVELTPGGFTEQVLTLVILWFNIILTREMSANLKLTRVALQSYACLYEDTKISKDTKLTIN